MAAAADAEPAAAADPPAASSAPARLTRCLRVDIGPGLVPEVAEGIPLPTSAAARAKLAARIAGGLEQAARATRRAGVAGEVRGTGRRQGVARSGRAGI